MRNKVFALYKESLSGLSREVWLLSLVTFINRSGAMVLPFLSVYLTYELKFTLPQAGVIMSCFGVGSVAGVLLGGLLTDKFGFYKVQLWSLLLTGGMFFLVIQVKSFYGLCAIFFITSLFADAFRPASQVAIASYSKPENLTRSISLYRLAINLGFSLGPALGGILAFYLGYQWLFILDGSTCILAALLFLVSLSPKKMKSKQQAQTVASAKNSAYKDVQFLLFIGTLTLTAIVFRQFFTTIPVFFKEQFLFNENQIGMLLAMNGIIIVLFEMPLIYSLEKKNAIVMVIWGSIFLGLSYFVFLLVKSGLVIAIISILFVTIGEILFAPFSNTYAVARSKRGNQGQYMGLFTLPHSISHIIAPPLGLQIAGNYGYDILWIVLCLLILLAVGGLYYLVRENQRIPDAKLT